MGQIKLNLDPSVPIFLVGNKLDLEERREVSSEEAQKEAKKLNYEFWEVSALSGANLDAMFTKIVQKALKKKTNWEDLSVTHTLKRNSKKKPKENNCACKNK